jgi:hypothetical protein
LHGKTAFTLVYHFLDAPGAANGIIIVNSHIGLVVSGPAVRKAIVDFDHDAPTPGTAMPTLQLFSPVFFHVAGGDSGADIGLNFGVANPTGDASIGNPDIMPTGSVDARFTGGTGDDTISEVFWLDPRSMGQVTARVTGGAGSDDLRLDVFGIGNPDILNAEINGGTGRNTAHHTANVRVVNCDVVYLDS